MPHLSKKQIRLEVKKNLDDHIVSFLSDTGKQVRKKIFKELITRTERMMVAKRLTLLYLIKEDVPTGDIADLLKISTSTIARFERMVARGDFANTFEWISKRGAADRVLTFLFEMAAIPFEARHKSLKKFLDEWY